MGAGGAGVCLGWAWHQEAGPGGDTHSLKLTEASGTSGTRTTGAWGPPPCGLSASWGGAPGMTRPSVGSSTQMPERHQTKWPPGVGRIVPSLPEMPRGLPRPWVSSPQRWGWDVDDGDAGCCPGRRVTEGVRRGHASQAV